jgi:hybrid cluster-associated redox disulfide protein
MTIGPDTLVSDVLVAHPEAASVFERHGLGCPSCLASGMDTLFAVASSHDVPLSTLVSELRMVAGEAPGDEGK